jgi:hypothetical protein
VNEEMVVRVGHELYTFDGRVLEVFGGHPIRFHVRHMYVRIGEPERKGARTIELGHGRPDAPGGRHIWRWTAQEWADRSELAHLLDVVRAASDAARF